MLRGLPFTMGAEWDGETREGGGSLLYRCSRYRGEVINGGFGLVLDGTEVMSP